MHPKRGTRRPFRRLRCAAEFDLNHGLARICGEIPRNRILCGTLCRPCGGTVIRGGCRGCGGQCRPLRGNRRQGSIGGSLALHRHGSLLGGKPVRQSNDGHAYAEKDGANEFLIFLAVQMRNLLQ